MKTSEMLMDRLEWKSQPESWPLAFSVRMLGILGADTGSSSAWLTGRRCLVALVMLAHVVGFVHFSWRAAGDVVVLTQGIGAGLMGLCVNLRFATLAFGIGRLRTLQRGLHAAPVQPHDNHQLETRTRRATKLFTAMYLSYAPVLAVVPWLGEQDPEGKMPDLLLPITYPVDVTRPPGFAFTLAMHIVIQLVYALMIAAVDFAFASLMAHVALRLKAVADHVGDLGHCSIINRDGDSFGDEGNSVQWATVRRRLRECIQEHQAALDLAHEVDALLNASLGVTLLSCSVMFCTAAYHVTRGGVAFHLAFVPDSWLLPVVMQLFLYCLFADRMRTEGEGIALAAYKCGWETDSVPPDVRRDLQLVLMRAQKPVRVTALRITDVSLNTFGEVMKLSYSYYNILNEVDK